MNFGRNNSNKLQGNVNKQWVHPADSMMRGHIVYNVKFLGHCEVDTPKGTEVIKDAIRKMKFNKTVKKAEGQKPPKVELTISADGVTIQDPKTKIIQYQYPLHRISYCADDKSDKRMFTFIAKESDSPKHHCYVFDSEKCAEEITLTVGQAFDLAYKKFLDSSSRDMDMKKQFLLLQKKVTLLQHENNQLKKRLVEMEQLKDTNDMQQYKQQHGLSSITSVTAAQNGNDDDEPIQVVAGRTPPVQPPQNNGQSGPTVGRKLEGLLFDENFSAPSPPPVPARVTNGTSHAPAVSSSPPPALQPPPSSVRPRPQAGVPSTQQPYNQQPNNQQPNNQLPYNQQPNNQQALVDIFGGPPLSQPSGPARSDPFGMPSFNPSTQQLDSQIMQMNQEMMDLQAGFSQGLSFGTDDFSLDSLDPLKN